MTTEQGQLIHGKRIIQLQQLVLKSLILRNNEPGFSPDVFWTTEQEATTNTLVRVRVAPTALIGNDLNRRRTCGYDSNYFFMAFHSVPGYSAFGTYEGNGDPDGPFVYTGHRSAFVMVKRTNGDASWMVFDTTRNPTNPVGLRLRPDATNGETDAVFLDVVSNGFKFRNTGAAFNDAGGVYFLFFCQPFGGKCSPANAR